MSKKISMSARPNVKPTADKWVEKREAPSMTPGVKLKRLTIDIDPQLHTELKISCAQRGIQIADLVRSLITLEIRPK